ncbi:MAG: zinc ABC transporter substrate-binding protein [Clostridiales bacterium]|nr:zinc ABC transporter substrate-binding protein [Clostridiales bacterium]
MSFLKKNDTRNREKGNRSGPFRRGLAGTAALAILAGGLSTLAGCRRGFGKDAQGKVKVVATIYPMYDFVKRIGGDYVAVNMMVPAGTEPHAWEPSSRDMLMLEEADLFVYNGAGMEMWADDLLESVQNKDLIVVEASRNVELLKVGETHDEDHEHDEDDAHEDEAHDENHAHEHHHGEYDPHVWLSPKNAEKELETIAEALIKADPDHADTYRKNLEEAKNACQDLDRAYTEELEKHENQYIVVAHEAYGYLCHEYGLTQIGIEGVSADQEPDAARMREIIDMVEKYGIKCIFFEELVDPKVAKTIAEETGCRTMALSPLDGLTQEDIDAGRDYFSVMKDNLEALKASFE